MTSTMRNNRSQDKNVVQSRRTAKGREIDSLIRRFTHLYAERTQTKMYRLVSVPYVARTRQVSEKEEKVSGQPNGCPLS